jgi:hypothetical protein
MINAAVNVGAKGMFTLALTNITENEPFSMSTMTLPQAELSSAEWIVEDPLKSSLADLVSASFTSCEATVGNTTGAIGSFNSNVQINMETSAGVPKAAASALVQDGGAFTVAFLSPGP